MAYIAPNSTAEFFKATGLSPTYENSLYFASDTAKNNYFSSLSSFTTNALTYQRENSNVIRVETNIYNLYNADYMRFINSSFENMWFYAFILEVNYINNVTTEVIYQIDPLMTWMGIFTLSECYVERQHTLHDYIGSNIADEGISLGAYVEEGYETSENYGAGNCDIVLQYSDPNEAKGNMRGGVYDPTWRTRSNLPSEIASAINGLVESNLSDNIVNVFMIPKQFSGDSVYFQSLSVSKPYSTISGYTPRNNKLFCYPYKYLEVDNSEGSTKQYKYEYFNSLPDVQSTGACNFEVSGNCLNSANLALTAKNYNGHSGTNYSDCLTMTDFPLCAWSTDVYQAYLAQKNAFYTHDLAQGVVQTALGGAGGALSNAIGGYNQSTANSNNQWLARQAKKPSDTALYGNAGLIAGSAAGIGATIGTAVAPGLGTAIGAGVGALVGLAGSVGMSALSSVTENMLDNHIQPEAGSRIHGTPASDTIYYVNKKYTFHKMCITKNYAMMIDEFFTMYGYKIRQVKVPNMNARPHFTYVKTIGCNVSGALPANDRATIEGIFDNGVRFWHNLAEMGNYDLDNRPND